MNISFVDFLVWFLFKETRGKVFTEVLSFIRPSAKTLQAFGTQTLTHVC